MYPNKTHQPPHIFIDNKLYFITARLYQNQQIISDKRKTDLLKLINATFLEYNYKLFAFVILNNHYHLLFQTIKGNDISTILQKVHGSLSFKWNKEDKLQGRKNFQNYWDKIIDNENDFWIHFNYIHNNPIKHGLVKSLNNLKDYYYCSYNLWLKKKGEEWMYQCFEHYPITAYITPKE